MLGIGDVRDYIAGLGIADNNNVYCGKLDNKKDKSIGVYNLNRQRPPQTAVGGLNNSSYRVKSVSISWKMLMNVMQRDMMELH